MIELVKKRGRAYRCVPCGHIESKHRAEAHFYKKHVAEFEVPFMCVACDFRGGDATKFQRHQESPGHLEKMDSLTSEIAIQNSKTPRFLLYGEDVIRLTKEESARHWLSVAGDGGNEETSSDVEDIREQILPNEPMNISSPAGDNEQIKRLQDTTVKVDAGTNTECNQLDEIAATVMKTHEEVKSMNSQMVETLSKIYEFAEKIVQVNIKQEGVIRRLEEKLDSMERRERRVEEAERDRRIRAVNRDNHHHRDRR